jgi:hypothetical protein|tara:strand:+ start:694 stop:933 length:240 start_codon:yes stop_codon:yes gene_type:complete
MSGVREPKDEEELARARLAILNGKGQTIEQVITDMIDEKPNRELVDAVRNGIKLAQENKEQLNLEELVQSIVSMQNKWA